MSSSSPIITIATAQKKQWDVIIIGSGMGGCSAAYQLAKHGKQVLIVEKGLAKHTQYEGVETAEADPGERLKSGKWPTQITAVIDDRQSRLWAPLGCGAGGSSSLYAAALQRLEPSDFESQILPDGKSIEWPFSYDELSPYYAQAEKLFSVCGTDDPLNKKNLSSLAPPPAMCEADRHYFQEFQAAGLHPYRLHAGIKYEKGCVECGGQICPRGCKQDANNACLQPALKTGNVFFVEQAETEKLLADQHHIHAIQVKDKDQHSHKLTAKIIVLAAGAYFTPVVLQNSKSENWPDGLSNKSGLVGKNLMFHAGHHIAFWPRDKYSRQGANKTIALRDYYQFDGKKYGEFQSTGLFSSYGNVVYALGLIFDQSIFRHIKILKQFLRIPAYIATKLYGDATVFATIVEDYPYSENRILADDASPSGMRFEYHRHTELTQRTAAFKKMICKRLKRLRSVPMGPIHLNYGHPCGTCKAGNNPADSVIDRDCRSHDIDNLYIADASFMPTSGGTNPSLTVAANALRVADKINEKLDSMP